MTRVIDEASSGNGFLNNRRVAPFVVMALMSAMGLGFALAAFLLPSRQPGPLESSGVISSVPIEFEFYSDPQAVTVHIVTTPGPSLMVSRPGLVTASTCKPGMRVKSGDTFLSVNGQPLLALATDQPLWRELSIDSSGSDVSTLTAALRNLGMDVKGDRVTREILDAFMSLMKAIGASPESKWSIDPAYLIWLPSTEVTVVTCECQAGVELSTNTLVATLPPLIVSAGIDGLDRSLSTGDRVLEVDGFPIEIDEDGRVSSPTSLSQIASTPSFVRASLDGSDFTLTGKWSLIEPVEVWVIPPSAITVNDQGKACVIADGVPTHISIIGSQLGRSFVTPTDESTHPLEVSVFPPDLVNCE